MDPDLADRDVLRLGTLDPFQSLPSVPGRQFSVDIRLGHGQTLIHTPDFMPASCKHPRVRVVAREEDVEFVECQLCGEVFDSAEFADILNEDDPEAPLASAEGA